MTTDEGDEAAAVNLLGVRLVLVSAAVAHGAIAWALLTGAPLTIMPSMIAMRKFMPVDGGWTVLFAIAAITALLGIGWPWSARIHLLIGAFLIGSWGLGSLSLWDEFGPQPLGIVLIHFAMTKIVLAFYTNELLHRRRSDAVLTDASERGIGTLKRLRH